MVHFYIGKGKGKTTAALGIALRAAGWRKKVYIAQFLKDKKYPSGEIEALKHNRFIKIKRFKGQIHPLFLEKEAFSKKALTESIKQALKEVENLIDSKKFDFIILDEILNAVSQDFIKIKHLKKVINKAKKNSVELICTGRIKKHLNLLELADYVSEIRKIKHPFDKEIKARKGIEY